MRLDYVQSLRGFAAWEKGGLLVQPFGLPLAERLLGPSTFGGFEFRVWGFGAQGCFSLKFRASVLGVF